MHPGAAKVFGMRFTRLEEWTGVRFTRAYPPGVPVPGGRFGWPPRYFDLDFHPFFLGLVSRWVWRFVSYRVTRAGHWFFWPTLAFALFGSTSLDVQSYVIFLYASVLWGAALVTALLLPPQVDLDVLHAERICAGETLPVEIGVTNRGIRPLPALEVLPIRLPPGLEPEPVEGALTPALEPEARTSVRLALRARHRGVYVLPGYQVATDFPFGLMYAYRLHLRPRALLVYPRFTRVKELALPQGFRGAPGGVALRARQGDSFELLGTREYQEGDSVRNIDWRATARMQTAIVREYSQEYLFRVGVVLDTHVPRRAKADAYENFERAVSVSAGISDYMARKEYLVDLFAAGPNLYHLTAGRSLTYLDEILDILACVGHNPEEPFATLEPEIAQTLGKISLIIGVFLDWNPTRQAFVEELARRGVPVKVVVVRDAPCTLDPKAVPWPGGLTVISKADFQAGAEVL
jgi:uncharacterized protein (DUF58 family)